MSRRSRRVGLALVMSFCILALLAWRGHVAGGSSLSLHSPTRTLPIPFRTWPEHDAISSASDAPLVVRWEGARSALAYLGVEHSTDRSHPHRATIAEVFEQLRPTIALAEGRARGHFVGWPFHLLPQAEPAFVHELATAADIPVHSLEPEYAAEVAALLSHWPAPRVAAYFALRGYWADAGGLCEESIMTELLARRTDVDGLRGCLPDLHAVDELWAPLRADHGDWRTRTHEPAGTWLADLADASREARGEHMVRLLVELAERGERVFAVVGRSHVIRQEPALLALLADVARKQ
jgi:hypothetical protein